MSDDSFIVGCLGCGHMTEAPTGSLCECDSDLVWISTVADKLAFRLRMAGRPDEAVDVEDAHAVMQEHTR